MNLLVEVVHDGQSAHKIEAHKISGLDLPHLDS